MRSTLLLSDALDASHQHINDQQQHSNQHFVSNLIANPNLSKIPHCNCSTVHCSFRLDPRPRHRTRQAFAGINRSEVIFILQLVVLDQTVA